MKLTEETLTRNLCVGVVSGPKVSRSSMARFASLEKPYVWGASKKSLRPLTGRNYTK